METDPKYEFEAPKWFDFTGDFDDELNDESSPNDLWFERVHPLHEPRDPSHHDGTTKPLLATSQVNKAAPSNSKPQTSKAKKNYNSKKSLGIKSIRTRRGEHENAKNRESSGKGLKSEQSQKADLRVCLKEGKDNLQGGSTEDGRETPDEIKHNKQCNFTPPWTNSPEALNKTGDTSHANKKKERSSSLTDATVFSPCRVPAHQSPLSPARVRRLKSSTGSSLSPKSSLLSKAVNGNCHQASQCGRKRRLLPAIPDAKQNPVVASKITSSPSRLPCQLKSETEESKLDDQIQVDPGEAALGVSNKPLRATESQVMEAVTQDQHSSDASKREDKHMLSQRPLEAIPENSNGKGKALPTESDRQRNFRSESETSPNDTSLEALLKQHNKKVAAARSQYDENGRKIRTAEPNFCPAPSHKPSSSSSSSSSSSACKRSTTPLEKPVIAAKQKRRSCVAAVSNTRSETVKPKTHSKSSHTNKKVETVKPATKQKRRSCVAALQQSGQGTNTEKELRDLIAQHNSRVNAKKS
ncbi:hypothetical protein ACROYT_G031385 [Oculina patagonica]